MPLVEPVAPAESDSIASLWRWALWQVMVVVVAAAVDAAALLIVDIGIGFGFDFEEVWVNFGVL